MFLARGPAMRRKKALQAGGLRGLSPCLSIARDIDLSEGVWQYKIGSTPKQGDFTRSNEPFSRLLLSGFDDKYDVWFGSLQIVDYR